MNFETHLFFIRAKNTFFFIFSMIGLLLAMFRDGVVWMVVLGIIAYGYNANLFVEALQTLDHAGLARVALNVSLLCGVVAKGLNLIFYPSLRQNGARWVGIMKVKQNGG